MRISRNGLERAAALRLPGYAEAVIAASNEVSPGILEISQENYKTIAGEYALPPDSKTQIRSAVKALRTWKEKGFPTCSARKVSDRRKACAGDGGEILPCPYFRPSKMPLFSSCAKCGCKGLKLYLETERCPLGKW